MACPTLETGGRFLSGLLLHIDCQGRNIGSYGYGALAEPGSTASDVLTGLLTIFVALYGYRLLLGPTPHTRDFIGDIVRVGLVLTLAVSWPAWRIVGYDVVLNGPVEMAQGVGFASGLPGGRSDMVARLQNADDGIVAVTMYGTGRLTGAVAAGSDIGDLPQGVALADQPALGYGRSAFLIGIIAPFAVFRLGAGALLAIAPLTAGLALFAGTSGLFGGWWRGLAFCLLGTLIQILVQGVELALLEPWLSDVLAKREAGTLTPSAPTELFVLTLAFATASMGLLALSAWVAFHPSSLLRIFQSEKTRGFSGGLPRSLPGITPLRIDENDQPSRVMLIAGSVAGTMRREATGSDRTASEPRSSGGRTSQMKVSERRNASPNAPLGSRFRRSQQRHSAASNKRDLS